jgi:cyclase
VEDKGAGEIIINSIEHDGMMQGYDISLIRRVSEAVRIPVVALGGAGSNTDLRKAFTDGYASAVAAGSMFVYHGPRRAVLINYPGSKELDELFD